VCLEVLEYKSK